MTRIFGAFKAKDALAGRLELNLGVSSGIVEISKLENLTQLV